MQTRLHWKTICTLALISCAYTRILNADVTTNPPAVKLSPPRIDFGALVVGSSSAPQNATLRNDMNTSLRITDILSSGIDFSQTNNCAQSLPSHSECAIQVIFKPAVTGPRTGTLTVLHNGGSGSQMIVLEGTGE